MTRLAWISIIAVLSTGLAATVGAADIDQLDPEDFDAFEQVKAASDGSDLTQEAFEETIQETGTTGLSYDDYQQMLDMDHSGTLDEARSEVYRTASDWPDDMTDPDDWEAWSERTAEDALSDGGLMDEMDWEERCQLIDDPEAQQACYDAKKFSGDGAPGPEGSGDGSSDDGSSDDGTSGDGNSNGDDTGSGGGADDTTSSDGGSGDGDGADGDTSDGSSGADDQQAADEEQGVNAQSDGSVKGLVTNPTAWLGDLPPYWIGLGLFAVVAGSTGAMYWRNERTVWVDKAQEIPATHADDPEAGHEALEKLEAKASSARARGALSWVAYMRAERAISDAHEMLPGTRPDPTLAGIDEPADDGTDPDEDQPTETAPETGSTTDADPDGDPAAGDDTEADPLDDADAEEEASVSEAPAEAPDEEAPDKEAPDEGTQAEAPNPPETDEDEAPGGGGTFGSFEGAWTSSTSSSPSAGSQASDDGPASTSEATPEEAEERS